MSEDCYRFTRNDLLSSEKRFDEICDNSNLSSEIRDCITSWKFFLAHNKQINIDTHFWLRMAYFYAFDKGYVNGVLDGVESVEESNYVQ